MAGYRGWADLPGLVGSMGRQGVMVTLHAGEVGAVPGAVSLAAYRVVQEALTNVVKHGGGSQVTVEVGASGGAVLVTVEDYAGPAAPQARPVIRRCPAGSASRRADGRRRWPGRHAGTRGRLRR
jgi:hypothetical protein